MLGRFLQLWTRASLQPQDAAERLRDRPDPVCYVLERRGAADFAVLQKVCIGARLPRPTRRLLAQQLRGRRAVFALERTLGLWRRRVDRRVPAELTELVGALREDPKLDVNLVPVSVYWGRAPQKERSIFRLLLSDSWGIGSRVGNVFTVLVNGRNAMVQLSGPLSLRSLLGDGADTAVAARRVARSLRAQFARARTARIGPDLSHRRTIVAEVLRTRAVRAAVAQQLHERTTLNRRAVLLEARRCAMEIAANYSHTFVTLMSKLLGWLWNRLYDGVEFNHATTLQQVADGNEIVYVPCHRSHMDYLLLGYTIYQRGFAVPHTAAGLNLNLPVVGRFLRKGGAFFIRRSFRGNSLYTVVFMKYLGAIMARGHSIEFFIEGGRSRTGRLLAPMTGMLSMTVRSYLREPVRPVVFVPVYFGYERIMEGSTYVGELSGKPKEKESVWGLVRSIRRMFRERYGRVHVNLGEPIHLDALLEQHAPQWRKTLPLDSERPPWVGNVVDELAYTIMRHINAAAAVTPVNLLALALPATPRQTLLEADLLGHIELLVSLMKAVPYDARVTVTPLSASQVIDYGVELQIVYRERQSAGDFVCMTPQNAILATYYRNNVLHLVALPSMIACCFLSNAAMRTEDVQRLASRIYPYIASDLFMRWDEASVASIVEQTLTALAQLGMLQYSPETGLWRRPQPRLAEAMQLSLLAQTTVSIIERYYMAIAVLIGAGSARITQKALEERCQLMAQRMTRLYGLNAPEFFDRSLFENYINLLRTRQVLRTDEQGLLVFDDVLIRVAEDAEVVLSEQIRHSILQVTHG